MKKFTVLFLFIFVQSIQCFSEEIYTGSLPVKILRFSNDSTEQFSASMSTFSALMSSATIVELRISSMIAMNENKIYFDSDKNSFTFYDIALNSVRHFLDGLEIFRLEQ